MAAAADETALAERRRGDHHVKHRLDIEHPARKKYLVGRHGRQSGGIVGGAAQIGAVRHLGLGILQFGTLHAAVHFRSFGRSSWRFSSSGRSSASNIWTSACTSTIATRSATQTTPPARAT